MKIKILMTTPENQIGECSKLCYATKSLAEGGRDITDTIVNKHKHLASLRFAYATVQISEISRACANQIVRSSHMSFMQESMRYVSNKKGNFTFIMPKGLTPKQQDMMTTSWEYAFGMYEDLIASGVKKEDARAVLPMNTSTN